MIRLIMISTLIFVQSLLANASNLLCNRLFTQRQYDSTTSFISYFQESLDNQIIGEKDLQSFVESLAKGQLINPIPHEQTPHGPIFIKASQQIHFEAFERYLSDDHLSKKEITKWAKKTAFKKWGNKVKRENVKTDTQEIYQKVVFNKVAAGNFMMGEDDPKRNYKVPVTISKDFEFMATLMTQYMWVKIQLAYGERDPDKINPSKFKNGPESIKFKFENLEIQMNPDNPVEGISWDDVQLFIGRLNALSDSSEPRIQSLLKSIIPDHKHGDHYRLPTEAEWEFVVRGRGQFNEYFHFGGKNTHYEELSDYSWFQDNSENHPHPVGQKKPLVVDGNDFYDLYGNVTEWVQDFYDSKLLGGIDPQGPLCGYTCVKRGGNFNSPYWYGINSGERIHHMRGNRDSSGYDGFRLARDIK